MATHADLRQCAVYGVCTVATKSPDVFKPHAPLALSRVSSIIQAAEARSDDNEMATDNAISALAALMEHHSDVLDGMALGDMWVGSLPVKADAVEACKNHDLLLRLMEVSREAGEKEVGLRISGCRIEKCVWCFTVSAYFRLDGELHALQTAGKVHNEDVCCKGSEAYQYMKWSRRLVPMIIFMQTDHLARGLWGFFPLIV